MFDLPRWVRGYRGGLLTEIVRQIRERTILTSPTVRATTTPNGTTLDVIRQPAPDAQMHFEVVRAGQSVMVRGGRWTRLKNGADYACDLSVDGGGTSSSLDSFKTISAVPTSGGSPINGLTSCLLHLHDDGAGGYDYCEAAVYDAGTLPDLGAGTYVLLATWTVASDVLAGGIKQHWQGGWILDDEPSGGPDNKSINTNAGGELQINDYASATNTPIADTAYDLIPYKDNDADVVKWTNLAGLAGELVTYWGGEGDPWAGQYEIDHTLLAFDNDSVQWAALGTGKSGGNTDHDDSYWHAYDDSSGLTGHNVFVDAKSYHTTGEVHANDFKLQADPTNNYWNGSGFRVDVAGVARVETTGLNDLQLNTGQDLVLTAANDIRFLATAAIVVDGHTAVNNVQVQIVTPGGGFQLATIRKGLLCLD